MNILLVSISAPPQNTPESLQVLKYARYLASASNLTVLTIEADDKGWRKADPTLQHAIAPARFIRLPHYWLMSRVAARFFKEMLLRPDEDFLFHWQWRKAVQRIGQRPDVIYTRATPYSSAVMGLKLKEFYKVPWVMHLSDPWMLSPHLNLGNAMLRYHSKTEKLCFEKADIISFTSHEQIESYTRLYPHLAHKFRFFPNVYNDEELKPNPFFFGDKLIVLHSGNFYGKGRNPQYLFNALRQLADKYPDRLAACEFIFIGRLNQETRKVFDACGFSNVRVIEEFTFETLVALQRTAYVFLLFDWLFPDQRSEFFLSKILAYMTMQRPILALTAPDSTCFRIIKDKYGTCFQHQDAEGIANWLAEAVLHFRQRNADFFNVAPPDPAYSAALNARRLLALFNEIAQGHPKA
jgi:glycosyltransferase involved in cell wall biosynthesis